MNDIHDTWNDIQDTLWKFLLELFKRWNNQTATEENAPMNAKEQGAYC